MKEFVEKLIEKIKVTSLEIIVTGTKDKPYFEIKYKEVGKEDYNIGYSSYDLNNVLNWKEECFEIVNQLAEENVMGKISDGYHTFNELYHHRAVLFATICNYNKDLAWKSKLHDTGDMYEGMFIVGIETPEGQATYHYDINPYWDMFKVKELPKAPKWDGHSPDEAIRRIGLLAEEYGKDTNVTTNNSWIPCSERLPEEYGEYLVCNKYGVYGLGFPNKDKYGNVYIETESEYITEIIAWQPLPAPYQKGE